MIFIQLGINKFFKDDKVMTVLKINIFILNIQVVKDMGFLGLANSKND